MGFHYEFQLEILTGLNFYVDLSIETASEEAVDLLNKVFLAGLTVSNE